MTHARTERPDHDEHEHEGMPESMDPREHRIPGPLFLIAFAIFALIVTGLILWGLAV